MRKFYLMRFVCILSLLLVLTGCSKRSIKQDNDPSKSSVSPAIPESKTINHDFIWTAQERAELERWKKLDDLVKDVKKGDKAALYLLGLHCHLGKDLTLDKRFARQLMGASASLGFAPAMDYFFEIYKEEGDGILALVYKKLTILFGHAELGDSYYITCQSFIKKAQDEGGKDMTKNLLEEIERIAQKKQFDIFRHEKKQYDKLHVLLLMTQEGITCEDYQYDNEYWKYVCLADRAVFYKKNLNAEEKKFLEELQLIYQEIFLHLENPSEHVIDEDGLIQSLESIKDKMERASYSPKAIDVIQKKAQLEAKKLIKFIRKTQIEGEAARQRVDYLDSVLNENEVS